jgi:enoyl-[acyl-carrier-protein] reductase (NADH)
VRRDVESRGVTMKNVVFVAPYALEATVRFVDAVARVEDARVGLVSSDPVEAFP